METGAYDDLVKTVQALMSDARTTWSMGVAGAIGEFGRSADDPPPRLRRTPRGGSVVTARGALVLDLPAAARLVAFEHPVNGGPDWRQELVVFAPVTGLGGRRVLTDLGPDVGAARRSDARATLFDLGIGAPHLEFCVRTAEPVLRAGLRAAAGQRLADDHPVVRAIKAAAPHRVCRSAAGRLEVYQGIGSRRLGRPTPAGPHTHLTWAHLDTAGDAVAAPSGLLPALTAHPAHPLTEADGSARPFDRARHARFQRLLERHAPVGWMEEKTMLAAAVRAGLPPTRYPGPKTAVCRQAVRVALRQLRCLGHDPAVIDAWLAEFEPGAPTAPTHH